MCHNDYCGLGTKLVEGVIIILFKHINENVNENLMIIGWVAKIKEGDHDNPEGNERIG